MTGEIDQILLDQRKKTPGEDAVSPHLTPAFKEQMGFSMIDSPHRSGLRKFGFPQKRCYQNTGGFQMPQVQ
jgi:hypothetical protein